MTNINNFLFNILLNIDKQFASFLKKEAKLLESLGDKELSQLDIKQKNQILKFWDRLHGNQNKLLLDDIEDVLQGTLSLEVFFKLLRFPTSKNFSYFWDHLALVDRLNQKIETNQFTQQDFSQLEQFLQQFGELTIDEQSLSDLRQEIIGHADRQEAFNGLLGLLIFSIFAHLDILVHLWVFDEIEPICLGWLFSKKLNPKNYQWQDGKYQKINKHKGQWTNPSRSLFALIATRVFFKVNGYMPRTIYGLDLANLLYSNKLSDDYAIYDKDGKKGIFIKKAKEGNFITYAECLWLLSDEDKKTDIFDFHFFDSQVQQETLSILKQQPILYAENEERILFIWLIYYLFQHDFEQRPKQQAYVHGYYYEFWELFKYFYQPEHQQFQHQWTEDLIELAQPQIG